MNWLQKLSVQSTGTIRVYKGWIPYNSHTGEPITQINRPDKFPTFDGSADPWLEGIAGFFATDPQVARVFRPGRNAVVGTFDITLGRLYEIDAKGQKAGIIQFGTTGREFQNAVRSRQFDTIIIRNTADEGDVVVGLNPSLIKIVDSGIQTPPPD